MKKISSKKVGVRGFSQESQYTKDYDGFMVKVRQNISRIRSEKKMTIEALAEYEMSVRQIKRILNGEVGNFTMAYLYKIAKALKMKPSDLIDV